MKKVFSKEKYIEDRGYERYQEIVKDCGEYNWVDICDGKVKEECGYGIVDDWCIEVEDDDQRQ